MHKSLVGLCIIALLAAWTSADRPPHGRAVSTPSVWPHAEPTGVVFDTCH